MTDRHTLPAALVPAEPVSVVAPARRSLWDRLPAPLLLLALLPALPLFVVALALEYRATRDLWERHYPEPAEDG